MNLETLVLNVDALKGLFSSRNAFATSASYKDWYHSSVHQFLLSTWTLQGLDMIVEECTFLAKKKSS